MSQPDPAAGLAASAEGHPRAGTTGQRRPWATESAW